MYTSDYDGMYWPWWSKDGLERESANVWNQAIKRTRYITSDTEAMVTPAILDVRPCDLQSRT
jgi:hypothetical protein